jgi:hypothetical protein
LKVACHHADFDRQELCNLELGIRSTILLEHL